MNHPGRTTDPAQNRRIHLLCTFDPVRISWIPQFVDHYRALGVDEFHLSLHFEPNEERVAMGWACERAEMILADARLKLAATLVCPFSGEALCNHHAALQAQRCRERDWLIWADIDEFQEYPCALRALIEFAERSGIDYFWGEVIDRIADSGALEPFDPTRSIWLQYPREYPVTRDVAGAETRKVTCGRASVRVAPGPHTVTNEKRLRYYADPVLVHHFKWDATVLGRLKARVLPEWREQWWFESQRLLDFFERTGGIFPLAARK
jgi:hypothetical protein